MSDENRKKENPFLNLTLWELLKKIEDLRFGTSRAKMRFSGIKKLLNAVFVKFNAKDYNRIDERELLGLSGWIREVKNAVVLEFWRQWIDARFSKTGDDLKVLDEFVLSSLYFVQEDKLRWLSKTTDAAYSFLSYHLYR